MTTNTHFDIAFAIMIGAYAGLFLAALIGVIAWRRSKSTTSQVLPKEPSRLEIHSADYSAVYGGGEVFPVTDCLRKMIHGDGLTLEIENQNFIVDGKNYVPRDPKVGVRKRLCIEYSFGNQTKHTIERYEHRRLVLPEESFGLLSANQDEALFLSKRLREFVKEIGPRPDTDWNSGDKSDPDWLAKKFVEREQAIKPWFERLKHRYAQEFTQDLDDLIHLIGASGLNIDSISQLTGNITREQDLLKLAEALDITAMRLGKPSLPIDQDADTASKYESLNLDNMKRLLKNFPDARKLVDEAYKRKGIGQSE